MEIIKKFSFLGKSWWQEKKIRHVPSKISILFYPFDWQKNELMHDNFVMRSWVEVWQEVLIGLDKHWSVAKDKSTELFEIFVFFLCSKNCFMWISVENQQIILHDSNHYGGVNNLFSYLIFFYFSLRGENFSDFVQRRLVSFW